MNKTFVRIMCIILGVLMVGSAITLVEAGIIAGCAPQA